MVALTLASPAQTRRFARVLARLLQPPALVTIEGDLGTGKTTLVREIMRARGVRGPVTSPSFTLAQSYRGRQEETLHHLDLYRLSRGADVDLFAWDDYCLLYTSDAADDLLCVDLGGRRIIEK